ncbi:MAG TPA: GldG family protein [Anaerolineales bacterium]|nr:GldG family protein [Anaerolineales bacterium]
MAKKKNNVERYAFIGLIVAGIALIVTVLLGLVDALVALKFAPTLNLNLNLWISISAALVVLGLAAYAIVAPDRVARFFTGRQARYGSNTLVMALAFLGILFVINMLTFQNPKPLADLTEDKQNTLAPQTLQALAALPGNVNAIGFFSSQTPSDTARQLLAKYKTAGKGKFDYSFIDPNANPTLARQYGITGDGKIALVMGKAFQVASSADETTIDQALILLISPQTRVIYFLTGHGEADINGSDNTAMTQARTMLENKSYTVKTLNLATTNSIPSDAKAIVIPGPKDPLLDQEVSLLKAYVAKGGSLVVMEDPAPLTNIASKPDPLANYMSSEWGIGLDNDIIIDSISTNYFQAIATNYSSTSPITQHLTTFTVMPQARSLTVSQTPPQGLTLLGIMQTAQPSQQSVSWGKKDFSFMQNPNSVPTYDQSTDIPGPLTLAASGENPTTHARVVVFGTSQFADDQYFSLYANSDVFVNSVDWAANQNNLINITPRTPITRTFNPPSGPALVAILLGAVFVIPGLVIGAGIFAWLERRRRG